MAVDYHNKRVYVLKRLESATSITEMDYDGYKSNPTYHRISGYGRLLVDVFGNFLYRKSASSSFMVKMNFSSGKISRYIPLPKGYNVTKLLTVDKNRQSEGK